MKIQVSYRPDEENQQKLRRREIEVKETKLADVKLNKYLNPAMLDGITSIVCLD